MREAEPPQPRRERNKKRTQLNQGAFDKCFYQDQRKGRQVTMEKLSIINNNKKSQQFFCIFFGFRAYFACIYFRPKFAKIGTREN